jgi:hypothetical protein
MKLFAASLCIGVLSLASLAAAGDQVVNALDKASLQHLHSFFGERRGDLILPDAPLYMQAAEGLGGPPDPIKHLPSGDEFISACRWQSCEEKTGVVASASGSVRAVGIISFRCHYTKGVVSRRRHKPTSCDDGPHLVIFVRGAGGQGVVQPILQWAKSFPQTASVGYDVVDLGASRR